MTAPDITAIGVTPAQWLELLYGNAEPDQWLTVFAQDRANGTRHTMWRQVRHLAHLAEDAEWVADTSCVWFGVATRSHKIPGKRGGGEDCVALPGLWVDIDIVGPNHARTDLPATLDEAFDLIDTFPLPPTWVVETGGGLQPWWLFAEMIDVADMSDVLDAWAYTWTARAAARGWHLDNVFDLARIMRLPGTVNRKKGGASPVIAVPNAPDARYGLDDLDQLLQTPPPAPVPVHRPTYIGPSRPGDAFNAGVTCAKVLSAAGWTLSHTDRKTGNQQWTRPGKDTRDGTSATVYADDGHVTIWTSSVPGLDERSAHDPFGLWTRLFHGGDFHKATKTALDMGYGTRYVDADLLTSWADVGPLNHVDDDEDDEPLVVLPDAPAFPLDALPAVMADVAREVSTATQTPIDLAGCVAIGVLSIVATNVRASLDVADGWTEGANVFIVTAMPPGTGKSPVVAALSKPLELIAEKVERFAKEEQAKAASAMKIVEKQIANLEAIMAKGADSVAERDLFAAHAQRIQLEMHRPPNGKLLVDDITPEALVKSLWAAGGAVGVVSSEGGLFDTLNRYTKSGTAPNLDGMLKAWSGDTIRVDRVGGESMVIKDPRLAICITAQPYVVERLHADPDFAGRGLVARFMLALPEFEPGWRDLTKPIAIDQAIVAAWSSVLEWIHSTHGAPARYKLSDEGRAAFNAFRQELEIGRRSGGPYDADALREGTTKIDSSTIRLALLFHIAERRSSSELVSAETVERAICVGRYWVAHAVRTVLGAQVSPIVAHGDKVMAWARRKGLDSFTTTDIRRAGVTSHRVNGEVMGRDVAYIGLVLGDLASRGLITFDGVRYHVDA